jgi:hypothetical protein
LCNLLNGKFGGVSDVHRLACVRMHKFDDSVN